MAAGTAPDPAPEPSNDFVELDFTGWQTEQTLPEIAQNPDYESTRSSRTVYQADRSLDLIEDVLEQLMGAATTHNLLL